MAQFKDDTILEAQRSKLKPPPMFKVMLLNDDYNADGVRSVGAAEVLRHDAGAGYPGHAEGASEGIGVCGV